MPDSSPPTNPPTVEPMLPSPPTGELVVALLPRLPTPGIAAVNDPTAVVTGASAPPSPPGSAPVSALPGALLPAEGAVGVTTADSPPVIAPSALTVLPSVDTSASPLPAAAIVLPSLPSALPNVVSALLTGVPRPVVAPSVCVAEVSVVVSGTMAATVVVVTCSTGPVSVAMGVLPVDVVPVLPDVVLPLLFDHVGELDAVIAGFDCVSLPPPSDVPMSPLPEFAQPASNVNDAATRAQGIWRNAR